MRRLFLDSSEREGTITLMYQLYFYVPESHLEPVKNALFGAGAGRIGEYDRCSWQTSGTGQFRPLSGSDPFIGKRGETERVDEYRVEMVVEDTLIRSVVQVLLDSHPYEEPAYGVIRIETAGTLA